MKTIPHPILCALLFCLGMAGIKAQQTPADLRDLVNERASFGESDMHDRGYVNVAGAQSSRGVYTYWWNQERNACVCVLTSDGRYNSITTTSPVDCNRNVHASEAGKKNNTGAAVAVGAIAAAAIGAAILSNKSHHHSDNQHYDDSDTEAAFEQGYRDGLYHKPYHNPFRDEAHTRAYGDGYEAGVDQREHETSYHSSRGGYQEHFNIHNLKGKAIDNVEEQLKRQGFRLTDTNDVADGQYMQWWFQERSRQCYMLEYRYGLLRDINSVRSCY